MTTAELNAGVFAAAAAAEEEEQLGNSASSSIIITLPDSYEGACISCPPIFQCIQSTQRAFLAEMCPPPYPLLPPEKLILDTDTLKQPDAKTKAAATWRAQGAGLSAQAAVAAAEQRAKPDTVGSQFSQAPAPMPVLPACPTRHRRSGACVARAPPMLCPPPPPLRAHWAPPPQHPPATSGAGADAARLLLTSTHPILPGLLPSLTALSS